MEFTDICGKNREMIRANALYKCATIASISPFNKARHHGLINGTYSTDFDHL